MGVVRVYVCVVGHLYGFTRVCRRLGSLGKCGCEDIWMDVVRVYGMMLFYV